jgi:hypothetical protein
MAQALSTHDHARDSANLHYVYPVLSRRAGGLSIGINFNTNNACNWRCVYCQVPDLQRGAAPDLDFDLLERELRGFLHDVQHGDFYQRFQVPPEQRAIKDIAISGNGEPTSVKQFDQALRLIGDVALQCGVLPAANWVLISNGSLVQQPQVQAGLRVLAAWGGEMWFKVDSATEAGRQLINNTVLSDARLLQALRSAAELCTVKIQTCAFQFQQAGSAEERAAYLQWLAQIRDSVPSIREILLYDIARPSLQPEASQLKPMPNQALQDWLAAMQALGFTARIY